MSKSTPNLSGSPTPSDATLPSTTEKKERNDTSVSAKLDRLTTMIATLAEKTNEALSEVAKLNERISRQQDASSPTPPANNTGFHLDSPKTSKAWRESPDHKRKSDKKMRSAKTVASAPVVVDTDSAPPQDVVTPGFVQSKMMELGLEDKKKTHNDESGARMPSPAVDMAPQAHASGSNAKGSDSDGNMAMTSHAMHHESNRAKRAQSTFSNRSTLRSRASMSSIDLNDVHELEALNTVIKLNVGGKQFCTTRFTLTSVPGTMFEALLSGRHAVVRDADGAIFLDRDADIFEHVLTYLRDPRQLDLRYFSQHQQMRILCEMDYFMVPYVKFSRELPTNITGHTLFIERDNQWTMKWSPRPWWAGADSHHPSIDGSSASSSSTGSSQLPGSSIPASLISGTSSKPGAHWVPGGTQASPPPEPPPGLKFFNDLVYVNMKNRPIRAYDLWTGQCLNIVKDSYCDCFAVSAEHLVTYDADDQSLRLWNARTSAGICWIKADVPPTNVSCLAFVNESMLVLGGDNNKCVTLNLPSAPDLQATATTVLQGANLRQIEPLSPSVIAVGSTNGNIILWNIKLNVLLGTIPTAQQRISTIFARNNYVYCLSPETIKVWDCFTNPSKPSCIATIFDEVYCLDAFEDLIVGIAADRSRKSLIKIWSLSSSKLVHVVPMPTGETVHTIRVQGNKIATILDDGTVLTWTINLVQ